MKICNKTHPELCHTEFDCPLCKKEKEKQSVLKELGIRVEQCEKLEKEINRLKLPVSERKLPKRMSPEMMRRLLGGKYPVIGFSWDCVAYFKYELNSWQPYNGFDEILPAPGFVIKAIQEAI